MKKIIHRISSKIFGRTMYPELVKAGGLAKALNQEFVRINSDLRVATVEGLSNLPFAYARVEKGGKFSQIYIAAEKKLYLPDFWRNGVCLAHAKTETLLELAKVIDCWLGQDLSTRELADKYNFVQPGHKAKAFDENTEVEYTWKCLLQDDRSELKEFIELASKDEILNKLFPFTSLYTLCFSRCTGYPYDESDLPNVTPKPFELFAARRYEKSGNLDTLEPMFVVTRNREEYLGEGNAEKALEIVRTNLPDNIQPAVKGTADD